jgi:acyl carrier protein
VPDEKRLVAYVVLCEQQKAEIVDLQVHVTKQLPTYMIPSAFVLLEAFPLTPNGKIDRRALPAPQHTHPELQRAFVAPRNSTEDMLARLWSRLLKIEQIGIHDDFCTLGGDSLMAMQVIAHLRRSLQIQLPLARFFGTRTIAELAKIIEQAKANDAQRKLPSVLSIQDDDSSRDENYRPSVEHLAGVPQRQEDKTAETAVVAIQTSGYRQPFFFLHGDFRRGAFYCFPLARDLGPDQPFYALEPYRFDSSLLLPTLETMAAAHIKSLRSVQPEGPYLLGGYCSGALVAYEMARQLLTEGQEIDLLVLINPDLISCMQRRRRIINRLGRLMRLGESKQLYWFLWLQHIYRYLQHEYRYLRFSYYKRWATDLVSQEVDPQGGLILMLGELHAHKLEHDAEHNTKHMETDPIDRDNRVDMALQIASLFPEPIFPTEEALYQDYEFLFFWTSAEYRPSPYPGKSTFFFTQDSEKQGLDAKWYKVVAAKDQEVEFHHIAGRHNTCKTIHLHDLTKHLRMCLNKVQEERS